MTRKNYRERAARSASGHFSSLWVPDGASVIPTTITTERKRYAKAREAAKKARLVAELEILTGGPVELVSKPYDGIKRHWPGVRGSGHDG